MIPPWFFGFVILATKRRLSALKKTDIELSWREFVFGFLPNIVHVLYFNIVVPNKSERECPPLYYGMKLSGRVCINC